MKFFVFHGYVTPDNYDASGGGGPYKFDVVDTEQKVMDLRREHEEALSNPEATHPVFRVIQGEELSVVPETRVETWTLRKR